jgi:hypothetical protein
MKLVSAHLPGTTGPGIALMGQKSKFTVKKED